MKLITSLQSKLFIYNTNYDKLINLHNNLNNSNPEGDDKVFEGEMAATFVTLSLPQDFNNSGEATDEADSLTLRRVTGLSAAASAGFSF